MNYSTNTAIVDTAADLTTAIAAETLIEKVEAIGDEIQQKQRDIAALKESLQAHSEMHAMNKDESAAYAAHLVNYSKEILRTKHGYLFTQKGNEEMVINTLHETFSLNPYLAGVMKLFERTDSKILRHVVGTAAVAVLIGKALGYDSDHLESLAKGALMHDASKFVGYINKVTNIPGDLNEEQWGIIKEHPDVSAKLMDAIAKFEKEKHLTVMREVARRHHIHYDMADGYPKGLEELSDHGLAQKTSIISLSDSYDTIKAGRDERPYKEENPLNDRAKVQFAVSEVQRCRGTQFDPRIADILLDMHKPEHIESYFSPIPEASPTAPLADSYLRVQIFQNKPETADEQVVAAASAVMDSDGADAGAVSHLKLKRTEAATPAYVLKAPETHDPVAAYMK